MANGNQQGGGGKPDSGLFGDVTSILKVKMLIDASKGINEFAELTEAANEAGIQGQKGADKARAAWDTAGKALDKITGLFRRLPLIGGLGIGALITQAHSLNVEMMGHLNSLNNLSDAYGDASKSLSNMYSIWGQTGASLGTIKNVMGAINQQGLPVSNKGFKNLSAVVSNLHVASGIAVDTLAELTAGLMNMWQVTQGTTTQVLDNIMALEDAFGFTNTQVEMVMKGTAQLSKVMGKFWDDADSGARGLSKGMSMAVGVMKKFGVTVQESTEFFGKLLDPENLQENIGLLSQLGISYRDMTDMLTAPGGQEAFFDRMMRNMPELSKRITALKDPLARLQLAKNLGMPLELAQRMAKATRGEVETLMEEYKVQQEEGKKVEKKQKRMAAESARFDEMMHMLKMKALMPLMGFVSKHGPAFFGLLSKFAGVVANVFSKLIDPLDRFATVLSNAFNLLLDGNISGFLEKIATGFGSIIGEYLPKIVESIGKELPKIVPLIGSAFTSALKFFGTMLKTLWASGPIGKFIAAGIVYFTASKIMGFAKDFKNALFGSPGSSPLRPMYVTMSGIGGGAMGKFGKLFGRIPGLNKLPMLTKGLMGSISKFGAGAGMLVKGGAAQAAGVGAGRLMTGGAAKVGTGMLGKAATTVLPKLGTVIGKVGPGLMTFGAQGLKALPVIGQVAAALMGAVQGVGAVSKKTLRSKKEGGLGREATTAEKTSGALAGGLTLGIAPLIDSIFGTEVTPAIAEGIKGFADSNLAMLTPIGIGFKGLFATIEAFQDKALSAEEAKMRDNIQAKFKAGEDLTKEELAQREKVFNAMVANTTSFSDGLSNLKGKVTNFFGGIADKVKAAVAKIREFFTGFFDNFGAKMKQLWEGIKNTFSNLGTKIYEGISAIGKKIKSIWQRYIGLPIFKLTFGIKIAIEKLLVGLKEKIASSKPLAKLFGIKDVDAERAKLKFEQSELTRLDTAFKQFKAAAKLGQVGRLRGLSRIGGSGKMFDEFRTYSKIQADALSEEFTANKEERLRKEREAAALAKKTEENTRKTAGYGAATVEALRDKGKEEKRQDYLDFFFDRRSYLKVKGTF